MNPLLPVAPLCLHPLWKEQAKCSPAVSPAVIISDFDRERKSVRAHLLHFLCLALYCHWIKIEKCAKQFARGGTHTDTNTHDESSISAEVWKMPWGPMIWRWWHDGYDEGATAATEQYAGSDEANGSTRRPSHTLSIWHCIVNTLCLSNFQSWENP